MSADRVHWCGRAMVRLLMLTAIASGIVAACLRAHGRGCSSLERSIPRCKDTRRIARRLSRLVPFYEYDEERFFRSDEAPAEVAAARRTGFERLAAELRSRSPRTLEQSEALESGLSDLQFTKSYRVPFQYARHVRRHLRWVRSSRSRRMES